MNEILNLTQHAASAEQLEQGVIEPVDKSEVAALLTFEELPTTAEMTYRAEQLSAIAKAEAVSKAMIGGAPYFMSLLETTLQSADVEPLYSFSRRQSTEIVLADGTVSKTAVFRHIGFVTVRRHGA